MPLTEKESERRSCAVTLSDMEMFVFPELLYSLMLANIMSPELWRWRDDPWFRDYDRKSPSAKISRLRQFIMDRYAFNLDLDTWGLTTKERELARFAPFIDHDTLAQSNALFGYEGDKYYFSIDIRRHFGLDKYAGNVIPYWKTETVEAMGAFARIPGRDTGAGECVSLSTLYAAALFVVLGIPLEKIYLLATPLHSQNFVDIGDGVITNNRRIVTKNMWFNGTALSAQARRSMEHERITIVAHSTGTIHIMYPRATISRAAYANLRAKLSAYLRTDLTPEILGNFLRQAPAFRERFVVRHRTNGRELYLPLTRAFEYEKDGSYKVTDNTLAHLLDGVENSEFMLAPCDRCVVYNDIVDYLRDNPVDIGSQSDLDRLAEKFGASRLDGAGAVEALVKFCRIEPRMPDESEKTFESGGEPLGIVPTMTRDEIIARVESLRGENEYCELAFHAHRDLSRVDSAPFLKAAMERNPVCVEAAARRYPGDESLAEYVASMPNESIYEGAGRLAQPDEVWNYGTGDGIERAIMLGVILSKRGDGKFSIAIDDNAATATLLREHNGATSPVASFPTAKKINASALTL
ncbi:MAG: hypothetical protein FWG05_03125 [Kiritimatiellaeota bacterium]|nr:hypothetical protein [Kiritimatiellota bacterium]